MPGVVCGFMQNGSAREANCEDHEDTQKQRAHRADNIASHTLRHLTGHDSSRVHRQSPSVAAKVDDVRPANTVQPRLSLYRRRLPAGEIEAAVIDQVRALLRQPELVVGTWRPFLLRSPSSGPPSTGLGNWPCTVPPCTGPPSANQ